MRLALLFLGLGATSGFVVGWCIAAIVVHCDDPHHDWVDPIDAWEDETTYG